MSKLFKKNLHKYIKENQKRGYSLPKIKRALITYGYDPNFTRSLIRNYRVKNIIVKTSPLILVLLLLTSVIFFYKPSVTTLAVVTKEYNFIDNIGLTVNESLDYAWNLENKGLLKSVRLNGEVKVNGTVKIYLEHENKKYLVFDNKKLEEQGIAQITGFAVNVDNIEGTLTSEEQSILDNLIADINKTKNNIELEIEREDNKTNVEIKGNLTEEQNAFLNTLLDKLNSSKENIKIKLEFEEIESPEREINDTINITVPINETNQTINITPTINDTIENVSEINIKLEYKEGSIYDKNNDGAENIKGIVDLTVENTRFNFDVNEENLCTRWDTYSIENEESTLVCYGSNKCCNFVDLVSSRSYWNETFYSAYGQYGATLNNIISAQVLYVDYNLSLETPYAEIYYSDWKNLTTRFYKEFIDFENICIESCILPNLNASSYNLIIEINNSGIILDSINYVVATNETINNPPVLLNNFTNISIFEDESYIINLSKYFYDPDNDTLNFNFFKNQNINVKLINETAILESAKNFTGKGYMFFMANDSIETVTSNIFEIKVKKRTKTSELKSLRKIVGLI